MPDGARPGALVPDDATLVLPRVQGVPCECENRPTVPHLPVSDTETPSTLEALFDAVRAGRVDDVRVQLVRDPALIDAFDPSEGCCRGTLLNVAVESADRAMIELLLGARADISEEDREA